MQIEIYDMRVENHELKVALFAICDSFSSLLWDIRYYECGQFEVYISANPQNLEIFKEGRIVGRSDDTEHFGVIEKVKIETDVENGNYLTISGRFLMSFLSRRMIMYTLAFTTDTEYSEIVREAVIANCTGRAWKPEMVQKLPGLELGEVSGDCWKNSTKLQISYENLMDWIYSICKLVGGTANIKMLRRSPDSDEYFFKFDLSESTDRSVLQEENPHVIFSDSNNNLLTFSFEKDRSQMANFAAILGTGEGSNRKRTGYFLGYDPYSSTAEDAPHHYDRYEFYVDAKDISDEVQGENGETTTIPTVDYLEMLRQRGAEKLQPVVTSAEFEIVPDSPQYRYQRDYFVGDFVTVRHDKFGLELPKIQLTGMIESIDENGRKLTPTFEVKEW